MNQPLLLHIVERLERLLEKLPARIQKPVLQELTPLKELFLRQRAPRFVLTGSARVPVQELLPLLFQSPNQNHYHERLMELFRWQKIGIADRGSIELLDARGGDTGSTEQIHDELARQPADVFLHLAESESASAIQQLETFISSPARNGDAASGTGPKVVGISIHDSRSAARTSELRHDLRASTAIAPRLLDVVEVDIGQNSEGVALLPMIARHLPHEVRIEVARISGDHTAQGEIAQALVRSTAAICAAIGTQPIPLADLPILTTLQLAMVGGIMQISGRERSLRAATEFITALGVNVGAGMVFREGARAALKFFPGWGNLVCGMVAGAGTYAIGKAATVYFVDGLTLKDARLAYLRNRGRRAARRFLPPRTAKLETQTGAPRQ